MTVTEIQTKEQFHKIINSGKVVLIDFYATWCGPCKQISPIFKNLAESTAQPGIEFYQVDVDNLTDVAQEVGIKAMPTFQAFKDGKSVETLLGAHPGKLTAFVQSSVAKIAA